MGQKHIEVKKLMIAPFGFGIADPSSKIRWGIIIEGMIDMDKKKSFLCVKNKKWLAMKLNIPVDQLPGIGISYSVIRYKNNNYNMMNIHEVMALYNCITDKHEVLMDWRDYARILKERREKHDSEE